MDELRRESDEQREIALRKREADKKKADLSRIAENIRVLLQITLKSLYGDADEASDVIWAAVKAGDLDGANHVARDLYGVETDLIDAVGNMRSAIYGLDWIRKNALAEE